MMQGGKTKGAPTTQRGHGTMVGLNTGKCLNYGTKNTYCRKCLGPEKRGLILNLMTVALTMLGQLKKWGRKGKDFGPNWGGGL